MITTLGFGVTKYITANATAIAAITIMAIMRIVLLIEEMCPPLIYKVLLQLPRETTLLAGLGYLIRR
jgi:hypothetical protein